MSTRYESGGAGRVIDVRPRPRSPTSLSAGQRVEAELRALCEAAGPLSASGGWFRVACVAARLGLSRATVEDHLNLLEISGIAEKQRECTTSLGGRGNGVLWRIAR